MIESQGIAASSTNEKKIENKMNLMTNWLVYICTYIYGVDLHTRC